MSKIHNKILNIKYLLLILFLFFGFASCKTSQLAVNSNLKKRNAKFLLQKMEENRFVYDWLSAKAKVKFESEKENVSFTVNLRMRHDSLIWMKVQKVSVEGMRVRMTPDRIEVLNRQDNKYIVETFATIQDKMPISFGFGDIEDLLAGNPIVKEGIDFEVSYDSIYYILEGNIMDDKNKNLKKGDVKIWLDGGYRLTKLYSKIGENTIEANFSDFQPVNDKESIAFEKEIMIKSPESGEMRFKINFNKVELNEEQDVKFEIPDHYEQIISGNKLPNK